jgi:hypothetical protein
MKKDSGNKLQLMTCGISSALDLKFIGPLLRYLSAVKLPSSIPTSVKYNASSSSTIHVGGIRSINPMLAKDMQSLSNPEQCLAVLDFVNLLMDLSPSVIGPTIASTLSHANLRDLIIECAKTSEVMESVFFVSDFVTRAEITLSILMLYCKSVTQHHRGYLHSTTNSSGSDRSHSFTSSEFTSVIQPSHVTFLTLLINNVQVTASLNQSLTQSVSKHLLQKAIVCLHLILSADESAKNLRNQRGGLTSTETTVTPLPIMSHHHHQHHRSNNSIKNGSKNSLVDTFFSLNKNKSFTETARAR